MAGIAEFPDCCGIVIVNRFKGGHPGSDPDACISPHECNDFLRSLEQEYYAKRSGLMAVLSQPQNDRIGHIFIDRKWILLRQTNNPRTGVNLYIYFRDLNPTALRERRIFGG